MAREPDAAASQKPDLKLLPSLLSFNLISFIGFPLLARAKYGICNSLAVVYS